MDTLRIVILTLLMISFIYVLEAFQMYFKQNENIRLQMDTNKTFRLKMVIAYIITSIVFSPIVPFLMIYDLYKKIRGVKK